MLNIFLGVPATRGMHVTTSSCRGRDNREQCNCLTQRLNIIEGDADCSDLMITELVSTKGSNTGFDAASAQSDEQETQHGQHAECKEEHVCDKKKKPAKRSHPYTGYFGSEI